MKYGEKKCTPVTYCVSSFNQEIGRIQYLLWLKTFLCTSYCAGVPWPQNPGISGLNPTRGI